MPNAFGPLGARYVMATAYFAVAVASVIAAVAEVHKRRARAAASYVLVSLLAYAAFAFIIPR